MSVITVQRAYEHLMRENLIHSRRGKGFFVSEITTNQKKNIAKQRLLQNITPHIQSSLEEGLKEEDIFQIIKRALKKAK